MTQYLTFLVDNEYYAMDIADITEIADMSDISRLPKHSGYMEGTVNLMGRELLVVNLKKVLRKEADHNQPKCILVVDMGGIRVGLAVDKVDEVIILSDGRDLPEYLTILDSTDLLNSKQLREIQNLKQWNGSKKRLHVRHLYKTAVRSRL